MGQNKKYTYNDWYSGKVCLNTCSSIFSKGVLPIQPISLDEFNDKDILKIRKKQKEIFDQEKNFYLKRFLDGFTKRLKNSKLKDEYLTREYEQCKKMLTTPVSIENYEILYPFPHTDDYQVGKDLDEYNRYFKDHIINGNERVYDFIHSPNYPHKNDSIKPRQIFAQALIEYFEFINTAKKDRAENIEFKKSEQESFEKIFNASFEYCTSFAEFQQNLQLDEQTLDKKEFLIKLREYKVNYSKALEHYKKYKKVEAVSKLYHLILNKVEEKMNVLLSLGAQNSQVNKVVSRNISTKVLIPNSDKYLKDIWLPNKKGAKDEYEKVLGLLLKENITIGAAFVVKDGSGKYSWQKLPLHCWVQYLAGFVYTCIEKKWIEKGISAPAFKEILCRTFNIDEFDNKPFKSLYSNPPANKYLIPFKEIPINQ